MASGLGLLGDVTVNGEVRTGATPGLAIMGGVLTLIGLAIVAAGVVGSVAREWVADGGGALRFGVSGAGLTWRRLTMAKRDIEEVRLRSDDAIKHMGKKLSPEARAWLRGALEAMVRG